MVPPMSLMLVLLKLKMLILRPNCINDLYLCQHGQSGLVKDNELSNKVKKPNKNK